MFDDLLQLKDTDGLTLQGNEEHTNIHELISESVATTKSGTLLHEVDFINLYRHRVTDKPQIIHLASWFMVRSIIRKNKTFHLGYLKSNSFVTDAQHQEYCDRDDEVSRALVEFSKHDTNVRSVTKSSSGITMEDC